jgi:hypothetical protein
MMFSTTEIESAERDAWADMFTVLSPTLVEAGGRAPTLDDLLLVTMPHVPAPLFNRAIGVIGDDDLDHGVVDQIVAAYRSAGSPVFVFPVFPGCSERLPQVLAARGFRRVAAWERIVFATATGAPGPDTGNRSIAVEPVAGARVAEWAGFLTDVYRLPDGFRDWLLGIARLRHWLHYVAVEGGTIVAARSVRAVPGRLGWSGVDGPVPGVMTDDLLPDRLLCRRLLADAVAAGATGVVADVEDPNPRQVGANYDAMEELGFRVTYTRELWGPG